MDRCPNCRRPVENDDRVCSFCDEPLAGREKKGNDRGSKRNRRDRPRDERTQRTSADEGVASRGSSTQQQPPRGQRPPPQDARRQEQPPPQQPQGGQTPPSRDAHRQEQSPRRAPPQQPPESAGRPAETRGSRSGNETSRRGLILGGFGVVALLGGGAWLFLGQDQDEAGPEDVAKEFIEEIDDTDFDSADDLIHPDSPLGGSGQVVDIIFSLPQLSGVSRGIDTIDMSVAETTVREKTDTVAVVDADIEVDLVLRTISTNVPLDMQTHDGDWYVWNTEV